MKQGNMKDDNKNGLFEMMAEMGHEQLVFCRDDASGYRGIIAIHSTLLGPAVGGTRFWNYAGEDDAIIDALRLSRGMTYKCAAAGMALGGGKAIIMGGNEPVEREKLFRAHGRFWSGWEDATSLLKTWAQARPTWSTLPWKPNTSVGLPAKALEIRRPGPRSARFAQCRRRRNIDGAAMTCAGKEWRFKVAATSVITLPGNCMTPERG